jgi:4-amino-4-deoxy-L-arabinose transferase-like glycosyltransferase
VTILLASVAALGALGASLSRALAAAGDAGATRILRGALAAFGALVAIEIGLGLLHVLTPIATLGALALAATGAAFAVRGRRLPPAAFCPRWTALEAGLLGALLAAFALRFWSGLHKTSYLYDALSYHLHAPVTWMHDRRLEIVPTPFGDPAPAYAPANVELWFLFLLAPLRSDLLAGVGQLPLAALGALAIGATVRERGAPRAAALGAALAFLLVPEIWQQAPTAMVDLGMASLLLASLPFIVRLARLPHGATRGDLIGLGAALGLAAGAKYVGALLALPFAVAGALAAWRGRAGSRDLAVAAAVASIAGGVWPVRNLIATGNPFYPVTAFGFPGLYDARLMRAWDYHLPIADLGALGGMLIAAGVGFALASLYALARRWRDPELPIALALAALFWLAIPYQESRFLFSLFGVAAVALGALAARVSPVAAGAALAAALAGGLVEWPTPERLVLVPAGLVAAALFAAGQRAPFAVRRAARRLAAVGVAVAFLTALGRCHDRDPGYRIGDELDAAWAWFRANVRGARVAYTGTNLAFPLAGRGLANVVRYVNVAGPPEARLHDFPRSPEPAANAEPAPYRDGARYETWLGNLRATRTEVLFVAALDPIVRRNIAADADGFPVERTWADAHPEQFRLRYASTAARVYTVAP